MSEPHKIVVKVWYNATWHDVHYNAITGPILSALYHTNPREYYAPWESEWKVLREHIIA